jgi:hypothetical protein
MRPVMQKCGPGGGSSTKPDKPPRAVGVAMDLDIAAAWLALGKLRSEDATAAASSALDRGMAEKGTRIMWLVRSKTLAWALVLLGGSTVGILAFAQRPKEPAKPNVPVAQVVGPAPPAVKEGRVTDTRPEVSRVLPVAEGSVRCVAFGPEGRIAAGYYGDPGGVVVFDARGERLLRRPAVKGGQVRSVAFSPEGRIAAGYSVDGDGGEANPPRAVGGVVVFDAP